ncbi:MAG: hypothetical protein ABIX10_00415 [Acidimicrobiales bacterium]
MARSRGWTEDGNVVYSVQLTDATGVLTEVKVDAGNGALLAQDVEHDDEQGSHTPDAP